MTIPDQTCWGCRYFFFSAREPGYSEVTPGCDAYIECVKDQWVQFVPDKKKPVRLDPLESQQDFAKAMEIGFTCQKFERR